MVILGSLGGEMVSAQARNARCGFDYHSRCNVSRYLYLRDIGSVIRILYNLCAVWSLNLPCVCMYM